MAPVARSTVIHADPPTPRGIVLPKGVFDDRPERNLHQPYVKRFGGGRAVICDPEGKLHPVEDMPSDDLLIASCVQWGMPLWAADQGRYSIYRRYDLWAAYSVVTLARLGDPEAKLRLDSMRSKWLTMRDSGMVHDTPAAGMR